MAGVDADVRAHRRQVDVVDPQVLGEILQLAVVVGHTHGADVVAFHEQQLHDGPPVLGELLRVCGHLHALGDGGHAGGQQLLRVAHLDQAQPAGTDVTEPVEMTQRGDVDGVLAGDLEHGLPVRAGDFPAVDGEDVNGGHGTASRMRSGQTPAGQSRSWMWVRYSWRK